MIHPPIQRTFRFFSAKAPALSPKDIECLVLPWTQSGNGSVALSTAGKQRWNSELRSQFTQKLAAAAEKADSPEEMRFIRVNTSGGGASIFLFVPSQTSTYDLHCEIRKAFADSMEHPYRIRLDVSHLGKEQERALLALSFLSETAGWKPATFGNRKRLALKGLKQKKGLPIEVVSKLPKEVAASLIQRGTLLGLANNRVRTLADLPANELGPSAYRQHVERFARSEGLQYEFWDCATLARKKAGAFLAVTRADPKSSGGIAVVRYRPAGKPGVKRKLLNLVGKGICFDTGGYNIKVEGHMLGMHGDMTGSAIALALCAYFAEIKAPFEVHAYMALAENLISSSAYKPNEVVVASDGTSIEVIDTDAEGRMILSDTLALASREKPDLMIDFATLTGAAIRALDTRRGAIFSNRKELAELSVRCGEAAGERTWAFPLGEDYRKELQSKVADILQCASGNNADHIYAATFLSHFAGKETPWVHLDLVPAANRGGLGLIQSDTTGFGVLWADEFVRQAELG